jgi:outer membrane biogenesis lipoprotein LolB
MATVRFWCALMAAFLLAGCSSDESLTAVRSQISHFREQMASQQFHQIYAEASDDLKKSSTEQQMVDLLAAINRKLGAVADAKENGWKVDFRTTGSMVTLSLKTQFERGSGIETFVYRISGKDALLMGYHVNSNDLILN